MLTRLLLLFACAMACQTQAAPLPADSKIKGALAEENGVVVGQSGTSNVAGSVSGPFANPKDSLVLKAKTGPGWMGITVTVKGANGESQSLAIRPTASRDNPLKNETDGMLSLGWKGGWGKYHVRPNLAQYKPDEAAKRKAEWEKLPGASAHFFTLELRPNADSQLEYWFDGQFVQVLPLAAPLASYDVALAPGAAIESLEVREFAPMGQVILPVGEFSRPGALSPAKLTLDAKAQLPPPFQNLNGQDAPGIAVGGLGTFQGLGADDLVSFFWRRHAVNNLPEQRMFTVPLAIYSHAYVLCAAETEGGKVPEFTLRVTRYGGSRGNAMADTIVRVPSGSGSPDARLVGTVQAGADSGRNVPLWLIKVPIKNGRIEDVLHADTMKDSNVGTSRYLDIELLDPLANVDEAEAFPPPLGLTKRAYRPSDNNPVSSVTVYGLALEKSPADLVVRANIGYQVFYQSDQPAFAAKITAVDSGTYSLKWDVADIDGKIVDSGSQTLPVTAGAEQTINVPVKEGVGWYAARFQLSDARKVELVDYRTSFAVLPPDTRKAGLESPFWGAWFQKNQKSDIKLDEVGPLMQRIGVRRVGLPDDMPESLSMKYGFTESTINWGGGRLAMLDFRDGKKTLDEALAAHEASIRAAQALWPSADRMLIFHESGAKGAPFPSEIWGEPAKNNLAVHDENSPEALLQKESGTAAPTSAMAKAAAVAAKKNADEWQQNWPKRIEYLNGMGKMVREKFPKLKMQFGNDGSSLGLIGELFRQKFPREYIDTISIEDLGQTFAPERSLPGGLQSAWFLRETARKMGYADVPVTACTEWIGRMTEKLGLQKQAEWKVRDGLLALAYGFDTISLVHINDASSGYYYSIWANGGVCFRYPTMAPKPAYVAIATLTQVLDQAKFQRFVPAGSTVLYVGEFKRGDEWVYAVWTPRGDRKVSLDFGAAEPRVHTDFYGRTKTLEGKSVSLTASPAAQYVTSKTQIASVQAGATSFPDDQPPAKPEQVIPLESVAEVSIVSDKGLENTSKARPDILPHLREGEFEIREVEDPEMGKCLEIELKPNQELRWPVEHEYVVLQLKTPVKTRAKNAGVWIKGNGSWGDVDIRKSASGPWLSSNDLALKWPGDVTTNFDGWNFIRYPYNGVAKDADNNVLGLVISLPRQTIYGTEMVPVPSLKIRLKSILLF